MKENALDVPSVWVLAVVLPKIFDLCLTIPPEETALLLFDRLRRDISLNALFISCDSSTMIGSFERMLERNDTIATLHMDCGFSCDESLDRIYNGLLNNAALTEFVLKTSKWHRLAGCRARSQVNSGNAMPKSLCVVHHDKNNGAGVCGIVSSEHDFGVFRD
jgi:hypothetical protein